MKMLLSFAAAFVITVAAGCGPPPTDYTAYIEHMPKSILLLPPVNHTAEITAADAFQATITTPLAEHGYYVYPVVLVEQFFKDNGLPMPGDMRQVPPQKLGEVFGANAVLYIDILDWETTYIVIDASTTVSMQYRLVDTSSGIELWNWKQEVIHSSSSGQSNIIGMVIAAAVTKIASELSEREMELAVLANSTAICNEKDGMLLGHRHPDYEEDQHRRIEEIAARELKE